MLEDNDKIILNILKGFALDPNKNRVQYEEQRANFSGQFNNGLRDEIRKRLDDVTNDLANEHFKSKKWLIDPDGKLNLWWDLANVSLIVSFEYI